MVSVCLPSDALLQHLLSYLGFSYLGSGVSLHGCSSKVQFLLLTFWPWTWNSSSRPSCTRSLEVGLLLAASPDLGWYKYFLPDTYWLCFSKSTDVWNFYKFQLTMFHLIVHTFSVLSKKSSLIKNCEDNTPCFILLSYWF